MIIIKIYIAADHLGVEMKKEIIDYLQENSIEILEIGLDNNDTDDYTDFAFKLGELVVNTNSLGILICGNGIGMSIAANKVKGIRCARILSVDDAFKCKNHNGSNVVSLSSETEIDLVKEMIDTFIVTKSPSEERYLRRIEKMNNYENKM